MLNHGQENQLKTRDIGDFFQLKFLEMYLLGHKGFIAGGCFKNIFSGEKLKDVDVFFESKDDFEKANLRFSKDEDYSKEYENKNVIAYRSKKDNLVIELIRSKFGSPEKIISDFDFTITKFCLLKEHVVEEDNYETKVLHHSLFFEHLQMKRLVIDKKGKLIFPEGTFNRMCKYIKYGFNPCRGTKIRMITEIQMSENSPESVDMALYNGID